MKKYDVTIGIPIYNSVDCIQASLMSALSQSYSSIEFLLVDDGCTDGSMDVVKQIIHNHHRNNDVHIVTHIVNRGVSVARNQIIDEALGEYLYFMDSDDQITEDAIELLMRNARQYDAELVLGSYQKIEVSGDKTVYKYPYKLLLGKDQLAYFAYRKYAGIQASACNYIVKTEILRLNHHRFVNINYWEDLVFTFDLVAIITRAVLLPDVTYMYICRENSLSHYQERINILKAEIMRNVEAINYLKETSMPLSNEGYFPNRCYNIVMTDFYIASSILRRRKAITSNISNDEIKAIMKHPATWQQICSFRKCRFKNQILYIIGKLPSLLCVFVIMCMGKLKKII
ncbi:glycosyltransferase family 2 protein [Xylanibacter ruminicola]|uniref:glycosyltransferase family 2 protein n=1 Tax=Xylanibacter ruminicola TaxID=839 RepID=UPI00055DA371|nr:glycosyltransferase family 2 protein [Xylanibacter ruminicola]